MRTAPIPHSARGRDRLAAGFLLALMAVGSLVLWIGVPVGCLYAASQIVESQANHYVVGLPLTLIGMLLFGTGLFWLNRLYMRITVPWLLKEAEEDDEEFPRPLRGPLEPMLVGSMVIALVTLLVWFFFFAENPGPGGFI